MAKYKSTSTKGYIPFNLIEPRTVKQHKEVDRYIKSLKITLPEEEFILKCLLSLDWNRRVILSYIDEIKSSAEMVNYKFTLTAPSRSVWYSDSNPYKEEGWSDLATFEERARYVYHNFTRRCI